MRYRQLSDGSERVFVLVFQPGDEIASGLQDFATDHDIDAAAFTAIGAVSDARLGFFDLDRKDYLEIPIQEQAEVASLVGDITRSEPDESGGAGRPTVHGHIVVALRDGTPRAGHLLEAHVRPTLEVVLSETPAHLRRRHDPATGLALIDPTLVGAAVGTTAG